jgi:hypothetical protein
MIEQRLRHALVEWLRADPALTAGLNAVEEESPAAASAPWLGIAASASIDWSVKERAGREVRIALELVDRQDRGEATALLVEAIETRIATLQPEQDGFHLVGVQFLRSRAERRPRSLRAALVEYRFRCLATDGA